MVIDPDLGDDGIDEIIRRRHGLLGGDGRGDRAACRWEGDLAWVGGPALRDQGFGFVGGGEWWKERRSSSSSSHGR